LIENKNPFRLHSTAMRRILKNSSYLFSATGIAAAISMLQSILVGRLLGIAGFGLLGTIIMFTSVVNKFVSFRMSELVIKYVGHYSEIGDQRRAAVVFKAAALAEMFASIVAFVLICLLAPLAAQYLAKDSSLAPVFILYGLIVLANLIAESSTGVLQVFDRYRRIATFNLVQSLFTLAITFLVYLAKGGMAEIILAYLIGKTIGALGLTITALVEAHSHWGPGWWKAPFSLLRPQARELTHFAVSTNISASLNLVNKDSELLWVSLFRSPIEAGYYKTALSIVNLVQMPVSPLPQTTYPEISREITHSNWKNVRQILRQGSILAGGFTLAATIFLAIFGKQIILLLYKDPGFLPAYPALMILLMGFLVANTFFWNRIALLGLGLPGFPTRVNLILAGVKLLGILLLVPKYGYLASAALFSGYYIISTSLGAWKTYRTLALRERTGDPNGSTVAEAAEL
jgi:O-antigen/teichoic acid export membrane protein